MRFSSPILSQKWSRGGKCTSFSEHHLCIKPCISHCQSSPCPVDVHSPVLGAAVLVLLFLSSRNRAQGGNFPEITPLFNNAVYLILNKRLLCFGALSWSMTILSKMFNLEWNFGESASDLSHRGYSNASYLTFSLCWEHTTVAAAQKLEDNTWCGKVPSRGRTTPHNSLLHLCCIHIYAPSL